MKSLAIKVRKEKANEVLKELKSLGIVREDLRPKRIGECVLIPVTKALEGYNVTQDDFESYVKSVTLKECLKERLGEGNWPRSYNMVGDIAIISLKDENLEYSKEIAECIMRSQRAKAVWGKLYTEGVERVAKLVHLGGERVTETVYKEHGLRFKLDITKVYINPSLAEEHARIASMVKDGWRVLDAFSGLGFFSFHIARRARATCYANDINPYAVKYMIENLELNKRTLKGKVIPILGDFDDVSKAFKDKFFDLVIMNLPHRAHEFVEEGARLSRNLLVLYSVGEEGEVKDKFKDYHLIEMRRVLDYAPRKYIWRIVLKP